MQEITRSRLLHESQAVLAALMFFLASSAYADWYFRGTPIDLGGRGNLRVYVLETAKTPAPGKIGTDGAYLR